MPSIIPPLRRHSQRRLKKRARSCRDPQLRLRYLIVLNLAQGNTPTATARALGVSRSSI
jgi:hypothetical protein